MATLKNISDPAVDLPPGYHSYPIYLTTSIENFNWKKPFLAVRLDDWESLYQVDGWSGRGKKDSPEFPIHYNRALNKLCELSGMPIVIGYAKLWPTSDATSESDGDYESDEEPEGSKVGIQQDSEVNRIVKIGMTVAKVGMAVVKVEGKEGKVEKTEPKAARREDRVERKEEKVEEDADSDEDYDNDYYSEDDDDESDESDYDPNAELVDGLLRVVALSGPRFHSTRAKRLAVVQALGKTENDIISVYPRAIPP